jgi:hypothetical protein
MHRYGFGNGDERIGYHPYDLAFGNGDTVRRLSNADFFSCGFLPMEQRTHYTDHRRHEWNILGDGDKCGRMYGHLCFGDGGDQHAYNSEREPIVFYLLWNQRNTDRLSRGIVSVEYRCCHAEHISGCRYLYRDCDKRKRMYFYRIGYSD